MHAAPGTGTGLGRCRRQRARESRCRRFGDCGAVREQRPAQRTEGGADQAPGGAGDLGLGAQLLDRREPGLGGGPGVSKSAASQICRQLRARDQAFRARGLGETGWSSGSWTPPTCPPGPPVPRRACWWPGAMTRPGSECSWMRCWASGNDTSAGDGPRPSRRGLRAPMLVVTDPDQPRRTRRSGTWAGLRSPAVYRAPTLEPGCHAAKEGCPAAPAGGGGLLGSAG
jgi:hypothetical protein